MYICVYTRKYYTFSLKPIKIHENIHEIAAMLTQYIGKLYTDESKLCEIISFKCSIVRLIEFKFKMANKIFDIF